MIIRMGCAAAGQAGEHAAGLEEPGLSAGPDSQVPDGRGDAGLADAGQAVEDHGLPGVQPARRGQIVPLWTRCQTTS